MSLFFLLSFWFGYCSPNITPPGVSPIRITLSVPVLPTTVPISPPLLEELLVPFAPVLFEVVAELEDDESEDDELSTVMPFWGRSVH